MQFQIRLKQLGESTKTSQQQLALVLGVSQSTVGMWESGKNLPSVSTLLELADYFHCSTDYLLGRVNNPTYEIRKAPPESGANEYAVDSGAPDLTVEEIRELRKLLQERSR